MFLFLLGALCSALGRILCCVTNSLHGLHPHRKTRKEQGHIHSSSGINICEGSALAWQTVDHKHT
jgi:hypothetical protein